MNRDVCLLAIDQGTTSTRAMCFSPDGTILDMAQKPLTLFYPHKGWVEQDPAQIWADTLAVTRTVLVHCRRTVAGIGITNQRETTIVWDRKTGAPVYNAIVWQDRRTAERCETLKAQGHENTIIEKTGLLLDPYFSATKLAWILEHVSGARARAEAGDLAFGTVECFVLWHLTGGRVHATDATNASRTLLYNIRDGGWDEVLLKLFDIPRALLPEVRDNVSDFGMTDPALVGGSYRIGGMAGDQQAALVGQACFQEGMGKATYGTGCFALMNIGETFRASRHRLLTTIGYQCAGKPVYALEGSIFMAGAAVQWLRDGLGVIESAGETEALARSVPDNNEVYMVPAFAGLGAPYWRPEARGMITGLSRDSTKAHIVRATLEAQAYQTYDLMRAMAEDSGRLPDVLRADGGLVANNFVCQFLADILDRPVEIPEHVEATAWGAGVLAGLQAGIFSSFSEIAEGWRCARRYNPAMDAPERTRLLEGWQGAVRKSLI